MASVTDAGVASAGGVVAAACGITTGRRSRVMERAGRVLVAIHSVLQDPVGVETE